MCLRTDRPLPPRRPRLPIEPLALGLLLALAAAPSALRAGGSQRPTIAHRSHTLREIQARFLRGELSESERHRLRVLAVTRPGALPPDLRPVAATDAATRTLRPPLSGTPVLVEAFQYWVSQGAPDGPLGALLAPPDDLDYTLDASDLPIRVSFKAGAEAYAQEVLEAAELAWRLQTERWGFYPPLMEPGYAPYRIHIAPAGAGTAGYTAPYARNEATPWADCFTYIVIDPALGSYAPSTTAHELNHAMQAAMDCAEDPAYWENTAVYIQTHTLPHLAEMALWSIAAFQAEPWRALDGFDYGEGYQYGGALWNFFLADAYSDGGDAGPILVRRIWEQAMQEDFGNGVHYFEATRDVLAEVSGDASAFAHALGDFCEARYFVGSKDDGAHIDDPSGWLGPSVRLLTRRTIGSFPEVPDAEPDEARLPEVTGCNHILVDLPTDYSHPIRVIFDGDDDTAWEARILRIVEGRVDSADVLPLSSPDWRAEVTVRPEGARHLLLVVTHLGPAEDRLRDASRRARSYRYNFWPEVPAPTLTGADPSEIRAGRQEVSLALLGSGFVAGPDFSVAFEDPDIQIVGEPAVTQQRVSLVVTVPAKTVPGPKAIRVTNLGGATTRAEGILTILPPSDPPDRPQGGGCQCGAAPGSAVPPLPLLLLVGIALRRRSRRRSFHDPGRPR